MYRLVKEGGKIVLMGVDFQEVYLWSSHRFKREATKETCLGTRTACVFMLSLYGKNVGSLE